MANHRLKRRTKRPQREMFRKSARLRVKGARSFLLLAPVTPRASLVIRHRSASHPTLATRVLGRPPRQSPLMR